MSEPKRKPQPQPTLMHDVDAQRAWVQHIADLWREDGAEHTPKAHPRAFHGLFHGDGYTSGGMG